MIYRFKFYDRVYYKHVNSRGEDDVSDKSAGRSVGFSETVGHSMTYIVLTDDTNKIIYRSRISIANLDPNRQLDSFIEKEEAPANDTENGFDEAINKSITDDSDESTKEFDPGGETRRMAIIDPKDLIARTYLTPPTEDGWQKTRRNDA